MATVYFVTNRNPVPKKKPRDFGSRFSDAGIDDLRFGAAELVRENGRWRVQGFDLARERLDPTDDTKSVLGSQAIFQRLQEEMRASGKDSLIFLHGYSVSFEDALKSAAQLAENHAAHIGHTAVFSWPSDGRKIPFFSYKSDRTDARASGPAFARAFVKTAQFVQETFRAHRAREGDAAPCRGGLHLIAHSMGNYVLRNAFQEILRMNPGSLPRLFDNVFMMAADEDHDSFEHDHKLKSLPLIARNVHVYFNRGDAALRISDATKANPNRLGTDGPHHPLNVPGNVVNIDVSEIIGGLVEHGYYVDSELVTADVNEVLAGRAPDQILPGRRYVPSLNKYVLQG